MTLVRLKHHCLSSTGSRESNPAVVLGFSDPRHKFLSENPVRHSISAPFPVKPAVVYPDTNPAGTQT